MTAELRTLRLPARVLDRRIARDEARRAWGDVHVLTGRGHLSVVADRPDLSDDTFSRIRSIADRQLRRLDGGDAA